MVTILLVDYCYRAPLAGAVSLQEGEVVNTMSGLLIAFSHDGGWHSYADGYRKTKREVLDAAVNRILAALDKPSTDARIDANGNLAISGISGRWEYFNVVKEWSIDGYGLPDLGGNS